MLVSFGMLQQFLQQSPICESDADVLVTTHDIWKNAYKNKAFKHEYMLKITTEYEKWAPQSLSRNADKKLRTSESGALTFCVINFRCGREVGFQGLLLQSP